MDIKTLMKKKQELEKALQDHGKDALKVEFKKFFDAHPDCTALRWEQFTPYFNDGEACEFSFYGIDAVRMKGETYDDEDGEGFGSTYGDDFCKGCKWEKVKAGVSALGKIDSSIYKMAFGDHVRVTATPDGFEVEEYDHD